MDNGKLLRQVIQRLNILISLQLQKSPAAETVPMAGRIQRLAELGVRASEIASIINKPANYVTATLSRQRKAGKKKGEMENGATAVSRGH